MEQILEPITRAQKSQFDQEGFLLVSKLIPESVLTHAEEAMHRVILKHPEEITQSERHRMLQAPATEADLIAIFDLHFREVAAQLAEADPKTFRIPREPWALVVFPFGKEWQWPEPHVDHALEQDSFRIFPPPFQIASISFLTDVPSHGGGTVVWPRSHKALAAFVEKEKYQYMSQLNQNLHSASLNPPLELKPSRGDVLFYHPLCAHSAGMNMSSVPRLALGKKW